MNNHWLQLKEDREQPCGTVSYCNWKQERDDLLQIDLILSYIDRQAEMEAQMEAELERRTEYHAHLIS